MFEIKAVHEHPFQKPMDDILSSCFSAATNLLRLSPSTNEEAAMPHIVLHLSGERDVALGQRAAAVINDLVAEHLGKRLELMATTVHYIAAADWFLGGESLATLGGSAFHLDISITDETNTKGEKARFLHEVQAAMAKLRPDVHELCYVHLIDARAAAYGFGGRSQEWRHQQAGV
ncbi:tautomerase family protein [Pseudomonas oryzihabitans]|uniref:tautomerase family protein n=1 Tax=Pseudomonas oryzihabitans TaxID=47885 RepID=UPI0028A5B3FA|nr:4-oxalocrotonate tautomerase [Pseudomonas oryzihabitans]